MIFPMRLLLFIQFQVLIVHQENHLIIQTISMQIKIIQIITTLSITTILLIIKMVQHILIQPIQTHLTIIFPTKTSTTFLCQLRLSQLILVKKIMSFMVDSQNLTLLPHLFIHIF